MDLSDFAGVLRRWALTLLTAAILAGAIGFVIASRLPAVYAAQVQVIVGPINTDRTTLTAAQDLVPTYSQLVTTDEVMNRVIAELDLGVIPADLRETITARGEPVTRIITIDVVAGDPNLAADTANGLASALDELASDAEVRPEGQLTVITAATPNPEPIEPQVAVVTVLSASAGLVLAIAFILIVDFLNSTVRTTDDLRKVTDAPFLGSIGSSGRFRPTPQQPLVSEAIPDSRVALAYRLAASRISAYESSSSARSIVVLGADDQSGSGEVAANLAAALARAGRRVRLVDANDQDRAVSRLFGFSASTGLGELAHGDAALLAGMIRRHQHPVMEVVPSLPGRDPRPVDHERAQAVLARLAIDSDIVILNTSPIHRSSSAFAWARAADGAVLVVQRDRTDRDSVSFAVEALRMLGTPLVGTLLYSQGRRSSGTEHRDADITQRRLDDVVGEPGTGMAGGSAGQRRE